MGLSPHFGEFSSSKFRESQDNFVTAIVITYC